MRLIYRIIFILLMLHPILVAPAVGDDSIPESTIYGHVYDAVTGDPVSPAFVRCEGNTATTDSEGRYAIEGNFAPSTSYTVTCYAPGYPEQRTTAKTDGDGKAEVDFYLGSNATWCRTFGGSEEDSGRSVQQTKDGGYVVAGKTFSYGHGHYDVWLIKLESDGNKCWDRTFGDRGAEEGYFVQEVEDGGYLVLSLKGSTSCSGTCCEVPDRIWLIKTDSNGYKIWDNIFEGLPGYDVASGLETIDNGYIIVSSEFGNENIHLIKLYSNGDTQWEKTFTFDEFRGIIITSIQQTTDSGYIIVGRSKSYERSDWDVLVIKIDSQGNKIWSKTFGGSESDCGESVQKTNDGGYIIAGWTLSYGTGLEDIWLIKIDSNGNKIWDKTFGGTESDWGNSIYQTQEGGYVIAGRTASYGAGNCDGWLIKVDQTGLREWDKTFGESKDDGFYSAEQTNDGGYIITGYTNSYGSSSDVWVIKTDSVGNCEQAGEMGR